MVDLARKTQSVPSLERALALLELLGGAKSGLTFPEIVNAAGLPRSSVHCLLLTLRRHGYVHLNQRTSRYMLGLRIFSLANASLSGVKVREVAAPHLATLLRRTGLTTHLAIREQFEIVLVSKFEPPGATPLATWLGKRMEAHCTGLGKAMLAYMAEDELDELIRTRGLPRHNENTLISGKRLRQELARIRVQGFALDDEEDEIGLRCIGAAVRDVEGEAVAAVSVAGTLAQVTRESCKELAGAVVETASAISKALLEQTSGAM